MRTEKFDEILDQCLSMMQTGASIDDCVARYPQHAGELRAQLQTAQTLWEAKPTVQPEPTAQAKGRSRLLTAASELQQSAPSRSALWFWPIRGLRSPIRLGQALPAVVALLVLGGLAASAAVIQPDVPVLREIFGDESSSSDGDDAEGDEPRTEIADGECELRGPITSLDPLVINGITIDASRAEELRGDLAQAMADGTEVRAKGDFVDGICIASRIEVHGDDDEETGGNEPRTEIEDGECELRGPITSLDPLVINGVTIDASSAEELRGDLAQALADGTEVRARGNFVDGICIASRIEIHEDDEGTEGDEPRTEIEDGECELRGPITSLDPLVINGITIDASSAEDVRGDLAQAMAGGTEVRVKGNFTDGICIAGEIKVHEEDEEEEDNEDEDDD